MLIVTLDLYVGAEDKNVGPHDYAARTLPTETVSPRISQFYLAHLFFSNIAIYLF